MPNPVLCALVAFALCSALICVPSANASKSQESMFQDDIRLVYGDEDGVKATLDTLATLGVDRIRVSVFWILVAPDARSQQRPTFNATDPAGYPPANWARYDRLIREAGKRGIAINLNVTGPAPLWATGTPDREDLAATWEPEPDAFRDFVKALGLRYNGSYKPPVEAPPGPPPARDGGLLGLGGSSARDVQAAQSGGSGDALPRVSFWSAWNEPNHPGWLTPQWVRSDGQQLERSPSNYRKLLGAFTEGLATSSHGRDTQLIGELAPSGSRTKGSTGGMRPLRFLRTLYCLDARYRPLRGTSATLRGCPASGSSATFRDQNPGLFRFSGFAHHPYALLSPPSDRSINKENVAMADLPRLHAALGRSLRAYGVRRKPGVWVTEYGFQTDPPDPNGVSEARQSSWLNEAEYMSWRDPRIRSHSQFLLTDDLPKAGLQPDDSGYWGTFQTGLVRLNGTNKPSFDAYRLPIHIPQPIVRRGQSVRVWGQVRPAAAGTAPQVRIQQLRGSSWQTLKTLRASSGRGFINATVRPSASGRLRLAWQPEGGSEVHSRSVGVRLRGR